MKKLREFAAAFLTIHIIIQCVFGMYYIYSMLFSMSFMLTWLITAITVILQWYAIGHYWDEDKGKEDK